MRDPRNDPRPGDVLQIKNKTRTVTSVGTCVEGKPRVCYEQVTVKGISCYGKRWKSGVKHATVVHASE